MTALAKAREETARLRKSFASRAKRVAQEKRSLYVHGAGSAGILTAAVGAAIIDAKQAEEGEDQATFGSSKTPIAPVVGGLAALTGVGLAVAGMPTAGAFLGYGGLTNVAIGLYHTVKRKTIEAAEEE